MTLGCHTAEIPLLKPELIVMAFLFCMYQTDSPMEKDEYEGFLHMFYADPLSRIVLRWVSREQRWGMRRQENCDLGEELYFFMALGG